MSDAPAAAPPSYRAVIDDLLRLYAAAGDKEVPPAITDAVTQALVLAFGSGLPGAALEGISAAQRAQAMLFFNAVDRQQKGSLVALEVTAKAVKEILSVASGKAGEGDDGG